jgi:hypothetical protein
MPFAGQIQGETAYAHSWTQGGSFNDLGVQTSSFKVNTDSISQFLAYGITDDLEINADIHYDPDSQRTVDFTNATESKLNSSGFSDPSFGVQWRALDEGPFPLNFDLFGSYTPDAFESKTPSVNNDGTIARGGQWGTVGAALGYVSPQFSIRGTANANIYGDSNSLDLGSGDSVHTQGYTDYEIALNTQTRINPLFSFNAGVSHTFSGNQHVLNETTDLAHVAHPGDSTDLHAALNYNIVPNQIVASATYSHLFLGNNQYVYAIPTSDSSIRNRSGDMLGVQLSYVFP